MIPRSPALPDSEVASRLRERPSWAREESRLVRRLDFGAFMDGIGFVIEVARLAERMDHHPDIEIRWRRVTLSLWSHDAGGITARDFELADRIDSLLPAGKGRMDQP